MKLFKFAYSKQLVQKCNFDTLITVPHNKSSKYLQQFHNSYKNISNIYLEKMYEGCMHDKFFLNDSKFF